MKEGGIEDLHLVVLNCVDIVLCRGQRQCHNEKLSLATYYSLFQVSSVSPKLPLYPLQPFTLSLLL